MKKYALLLGSAPEDFRQKKIEEMFDFLDSKKSAGDSIVTFANGISELMLEMVMDNSVRQLAQDRHSELDSEYIDKVVSTGSTTTDKKTVSLSGLTRQSADKGVSTSVGGVASPTVATTTKDKSNSILLYICTLQPVGESEKSFWLGGEEIRRDVIRHYQTLTAECGIDMQVVMDFDSEMVGEEELGWKEVSEKARTLLAGRNE